MDQDELLRRYAAGERDFREADLWGAGLLGADLSEANLKRTNLRKANLWGAYLRKANFWGAYLREANLKGANLKGANLSRTDLSEFDLSGFNLSKANLSGCYLIASKLLNANLNAATLTGACIEDWHTNSQTNLRGVICDYIYLRYNPSATYPEKRFTERRPHDPNKIFAPGEFTKLFQKARETVDLIFRDGIDWNIFATSFQELQQEQKLTIETVESNNSSFSVRAIENKDDGTFVIRINVPPKADKMAIERSFWQKYQPMLAAKEELLLSSRNDIQRYREDIAHQRQQNSQLMELVKTMQEKENSKYHIG